MIDFYQLYNLNNPMESRNYELSVFVQSICSPKLQKTTFYTIMLRTGQKEIQLSQKKPLTEWNLISILETLTLKLTSQQLQLANQQASLIIYSVQKYGKKNLLGQFNFQLEFTNRKEIRAKFNFNNELSAQIKMSYGLFKAESSVLQQKSSLSGLQRSSTPRHMKKESELNFFTGLLIPQKQRMQMSRELSIQNKAAKSQLKTTSSEEIRKKVVGSPNTYILIEQHLKLMESCENFLQNCTKQKMKQASNENNNTQLGSRSKFFDKINQLKGSLTKIHQKEKMLENEEQIEDIVNSQLKQSVQPIGYKIQCLFGKSGNFQEVMNYNFPRQSPRTSNKNSKISLVGRQSPPFDQNVSFANVNALSKVQAVVSQKKLSLIKPRTRIDSYQQWQNDDNLRNVVLQNIDEVKGCNGFIKLSKLLFLRKKYEEARKSNKFLTEAMNVLIQNEMVLKKKIQISNKIIKQKQQILNQQLNLLRNQFKQASNKLLERYKEEAFMEQKLKEMQAKNEKYQQKIRKLNNELEIKTKHMRHLRQALVYYQQQQVAPFQPKKEEVKIQNKQKQPKFKRSSSNNLLKLEKDESQKRHKLSTSREKSQLNLSSYSRENLNELKGINPTFIDFFTSFRPKNIDSYEHSSHYNSLKLPIKRNRISQKHRNSIDNQPSIINRSSSLFGYI